MSRLFDPLQLLNGDTPENATKRDPLPQGEVIAFITKIEIAEGKAGPDAKNPGAPWARLDCQLEITDPDYCAQIAGDPKPTKVVTTLGIMLDMNGKEIASGPNKNVRLGRLREATDTNGKPLAMMVNRPLRIVIGHKPHYKNPDDIVDEIVNYTKA